MKNVLLTLSLIILPLVTCTVRKLLIILRVRIPVSCTWNPAFCIPTERSGEGIAVRQNISSYYVDQSATVMFIRKPTEYFLSLRYEYFIEKLNAGISTGLRYTGFQSTISGNSSDKADFFYLRYSEVNTDTKFARVKDITETKGFATIPVELAFYTFPLQKYSIVCQSRN